MKQGRVKSIADAAARLALKEEAVMLGKQTRMGSTLAIAMVISVVCLLGRAVAMDETKILENYGNAVVLIASFNETDASLSQGSGFIVDSNGLIVSNYHVVAHAYRMVVQLISGETFTDITLVDFDSTRDIAVLKVKEMKLPCVHLADSDSVKVGQKVVVIGNPKGLSNTVSNGLLSGVRDLGEGFKVFQMSAPISPGSSGSPVFDEEGNVIGIATASIGGGQNLNFSIPINYARSMISDGLKVSLKQFAESAIQPQSTGGVATPPRKIRGIHVALAIVLAAMILVLSAMIIAKPAQRWIQARNQPMACIVDRGTKASTRLDSKVLSIGRSGACDLMLNDPLASAVHAKILSTGTGFELVDNASENGTWVNGELVTHTRLWHGDHIKIGETELLFLIERSEHK